MAKRKYSFLADEDEKYEQEYQREIAHENKLKENEIKTQLANKGKQGVSMVSGNISPIIGELNTYHIVDWYPDTPIKDRNPANVTWELFRERRGGKFTTTHIKKVGISSFTFGQTALGGTFRLEAYLHHPEGGGLIIKPKNSKIPKIGKVDLYYVDDKKGDTFSFYDRLRAKAHTTSMFGKEIVFTLWEDDVKGDGHDAKNEAIEMKTAYVQDNGLAMVEFTLTKALMKKAMKGEAHAEELEFYVTAEYYKGKIHDSENVNVKNPLYWTPGVVPAPIGTKKPERKPTIKAKNSPAEQKPISKREEKNILLPQAKDYLQHDWAEIKGKALKNKEITVFTDYGNSLVGVEKQVKAREKKTDKEKLIIFPLLVKPENDSKNKWGKIRNWTAKQGSNMTTFNANRDKGRRKHAARDLYTNPLEPVVAIADGVVLDVKLFYCETSQVSVRHKLKDGRDFIIRYGELDPSSIKVKKGDEIKQKKELGKTGKLLKIVKEKRIPLMVLNDDVVFMLHFEHFSGALGFNLNSNPLSNSSTPYNRRNDLIDSLAILQEGYNNSFGEEPENINTEHREFTEHDARLALMKIYHIYDLEMAKTIEMMYRWECSHFKSDQYKICGAPGMEVSGDKQAPNYGWDSSLYSSYPEYKPVGLWESFENVGMSGKGGNIQVKDRKKKYIKFPSVEAGMMYIANFIKRHNGNVGRWHALDNYPEVQKAYEKNIKTCIPRIVNSF
ncbi:M23 family metallopeptidase [Chryseobacterium sp. MMS23-Vi53]|uniref:M23 family metallopeptidase n=1 Tax=Chryseobacterium sp. MMS23-Vi53 TaxID=3386644 RepID=UPI0039ECCF23